MIEKVKSSIAVIPARGGSRRIPGKNMIEFGSKPALAHAIGLVLQSGVFDGVLVSTDDPQIAECARSEGAQVIDRPAELSDDYTPIQPVIVHAIDSAPNAEVVCLVLSTAILLAPERLRRAHKILLSDQSLDFVIGVRRFESPPQRGLLLDKNGFVSMQSPEMFNKRSQDLPALFHDAGQFAFGRREAWVSGKPSFTSRTRAVELPRWEAVDIDDPEDLIFAKLLFKLNNKK